MTQREAAADFQVGVLRHRPAVSVHDVRSLGEAAVEPARRMRQSLGLGPSTALLVLVALILAVSSLSACSPPLPNPPQVSDLIRNLGRYSGRQVTMVLEHGPRPGADDAVPPPFTRSDDYLHDATGTILVTGAWQAWNRWTSEGAYQSASIKITASGVWTVTGRVRVAPGNLPYLEVAP
ncbi:MAG: hypothetical protein Q8P31_02255 [Bacillota bacterium]|nr:hypothetical protein [Bacillota bacterium]